MRVVISQPRYMPISSYVQRIVFADKFVLLDNIKRQPYGWENRNKLLLPKPKWLTIPISSSRLSLIQDAKTRGMEWVEEHKRLIATHYSQHPYFDSKFVDIYFSSTDSTNKDDEYFFVDIVEQTLRNIGVIFDFTPNFVRASQIEDQKIGESAGPDKLLAICQSLSTDVYVSGENGRNYGIGEVFSGSGIAVKYHEVQQVEYEQPHQPAFIPYMGFFDSLFCVGKDAFAREIFSPLLLHDH